MSAPRPRAVVAAALAAALALSLAACGSSKSTASSNPHAKTVKLFVVGDASSATPGLPTEPYAQVAKAAVAGFNSRHHDIQISATFCDGKGTANATLGCAKEGTTGGYDAIVITNSFSDFLIAKAAAAAHIPVLAGAADDPQTWDNADVTCMSSTLLGGLFGLGPIAKSAGFKKVGTVSFSGPSQSGALIALTKQSLGQAGVGFAGDIQVPLAQSDWTPAITQEMSQHPDALSLIPYPGPNAANVFKQARQVSASVKFIEPSFELNQQVAATPQLQGTAVSAWAMPPQTPGVQGTAMFRSDMQKSGNESQDLSEPYELEWLAEQLAGNLGALIPGPVTPQSFKKALASAKNVSMYGITPNYTGSLRGTGPVGSPTCVWDNTVVDAEVKGGKLVADTPGQFINLATDKPLRTK